MTTKLIGKLNSKSYNPLLYFTEKVPAGFLSPASGYVETSIDLNELCISHPNATFLVRAGKLSMLDAGIYYEDLLIIDRSLEVQYCDINVCAINGKFTVKALCLK